MTVLEQVVTQAVGLAGVAHLGLGVTILIVVAGALLLVAAQYVGTIHITAAPSGPVPDQSETPTPGVDISNEVDPNGGDPSAGG